MESSTDLPSDKVEIAVPTKSRKGQAAKHRDAEKFRLSRNNFFDKKQKAKFAEARTLPTAVTSIFADLSYSPSIRPPVSFSVVYSILPRLILLITTCLKESKVMLTNDEIIALCLITIRQIQVRVHRARLGSQFPPLSEEEADVAKVARVFKENIFPLTHYVMLFGKIRMDNQVHYPTTSFSVEQCRAAVLALNLPVDFAVPGNVVALGDGNNLYGVPVWIRFPTVESIEIARAMGVLHPNHMLFTEQFMANPMQFQTAGLFHMTPPSHIFPTHDDLVPRYHSIMSKVTRRLNNCVEKIDWDSEGHTAQLVGVPSGPATRYDVCSDRFVPDDALTIGAVLKLRPIDDVDEDRVCVTMDVETAGALERYARSVLERARAL